MSVIKGTNTIVAGFGGTKRSIGEVYFSQSSLATDNSGALPLFTGETIASANTIYPDFYNWVLAHTELQCTSEEYESALSTYGECPKYVVDENGGTTTGTITVYGWLASGSTFYTKARNPVAGDSVWSSTDTTQESNYTVISLSNDTLTFSGPTREWSGTYSTTTTGTGIVSTSGTSLRLPKLSNYIKVANTAEGITQKEAGLPNITGRTGRFAGRYEDGTGALRTVDYGQSSGTRDEQYNSSDITIDASLSNPVYGKSDTVTPAHTTLYPWVVAYAAAIPASEAQAAEFQQGLSGKADTNLGNVASNLDYVVESYSDDSGNWYRKYKSGWVEQGGISTVRTVTFLKTFANTNYTLTTACEYGAGDANNNIHVEYANNGKTTTGFSWAISIGKYVKAFNWEAKGQGA